jgi:hypothetical protein
MAQALFAAARRPRPRPSSWRCSSASGGVYDAVGTPIVVGNEADEDDLWLLDVEVEALAIAFVAMASSTPLDGLASRWRGLGVEVVEDWSRPRSPGASSARYAASARRSRATPATRSPS